MLSHFPYQKIFCIGIGGIGVSGLAELLHCHGYAVSGSDLSDNDQTKHLKSLGIPVFQSHDASHIGNADLVVYSSAVAKNNSELTQAREKNITVMSRGELLAIIMQAANNIVIAGTHGKTTTTSLIAYLFEKANKDPSFMIGGVLSDRVSSVRFGKLEFFIAESDESDASFLFLSPTVAVITNIDADHLEAYDHSFDNLKKSFVRFTQKIPSDGFVIACIDNKVVRELLPQITCQVVTYGQDEHADYQLQDFQQSGLQSQFTIKTPERESIHIQLNLPGLHNGLNAVAAFIAAQIYQLPEEHIKLAFLTFPGIGRRFSPHGKIALQNGSALLFDDYGHHPREIQVTLRSAKAAWPDRRVVMVFQPHRYTRTRDLMQEFVDVLKTADKLVLIDVYAASEQKIEGADGKALFEAVKVAGADQACFVPKLTDLPNQLQRILKPDDIVILQGAGNIVTIVDTLLNRDPLQC